MKRYKSFIADSESDFLSPILENTFDINKDVDYLYNLFFKEFVNDFNNKKINLSYFILLDKIKVKSSILETEDAKKAHEINPIMIIRNLSYGAGYDSLKSNINLSLNKKTILLFIKYKYDLELIKDNLSISNFKSIIQEITEHRIKSMISHELSHWISDSLYNSHLTSLALLAKQNKNPELMKLDKENINLTYFEIDAQIHGIKNLKRQFKDEWDLMTLEDVFFYYNNLKNTAQDVWYNYGKETLEIWEKNLLKRMQREGLLGKKMNHFVNIETLTEDLYKF